jgi:hypothetical protein
VEMVTPKKLGLGGDCPHKTSSPKLQGGPLPATGAANTFTIYLSYNIIPYIQYH